MRVVFAGTPEFAQLALSAILAAGHDVPLVLTQPDRPSGRGLKLIPSAVKQAAVAAGIPVLQPPGLRLDGKYAEAAAVAREALSDAAPDLIVVAAYGLILPDWFLKLPAHGCFNIHASLLPRWRGAAPIQRAIEAGDAVTGVTIMQVNQGLDTGDMLLKRSLPITQAHTAASLHDELAVMGAQAVVAVIADCAAGRLQPCPQPEQGATYARKLEKSEALLDLAQPAVVLARRVRAFNPVPGAVVRLPGLDAPVKVWVAQAMAQRAHAQAGEVLSAGPQGIDLATGDGVLRLLELQKAGGRRQPVAAFVQGWRPAH